MREWQKITITIILVTAFELTFGFLPTLGMAVAATILEGVWNS